MAATHTPQKKTIHCGRAVGTLVGKCKGGWGGLVEFANNREDFEDIKSRKKGTRELHGLACSINYDRHRDGYMWS